MKAIPRDIVLAAEDSGKKRTERETNYHVRLRDTTLAVALSPSLFTFYTQLSDRRTTSLLSKSSHMNLPCLCILVAVVTSFTSSIAHTHYVNPQVIAPFCNLQAYNRHHQP
jgi:hypothetical protein